ncbi:hypothetical protein QVG61_12195 [Thiohalobacter sp. IOR34]|uniref:hypothetical protein n=1 Tax=Thiohalobacter sp. IOR34 TaxID=3057176 RepID=UPI0025B02FFE|nr:hypothetical protein [Thiohalobacter sp. IOR34]WJW75234.1 hypothetical protein QVG61_12195 [Thiohalobacter sp. IOR34]
MTALFQTLLQICLLRAGPQRLPASGLLLGAGLLAYLLLDLISGLAYLSLSRSLGAAVLDSLILAAFVQLCLRLVGHPERFLQTLSAVFGCWLLLGILALPLTFALAAAPENGGGLGGLLLMLLVLLVWSLSVLGHILRHALEVPLAVGIGISLGYFLVSQFILEALFPVS